MNRPQRVSSIGDVTPRSANLRAVASLSSVEGQGLSKREAELVAIEGVGSVADLLRPVADDIHGNRPRSAQVIELR